MRSPAPSQFWGECQARAPFEMPRNGKADGGPTRARLPGFESWPTVTDWEAGKNRVITANLRRAGTPELVQIKHLAQGIVTNTSIIRANQNQTNSHRATCPQNTILPLHLTRTRVLENLQCHHPLRPESCLGAFW